MKFGKIIAAALAAAAAASLMTLCVSAAQDTSQLADNTAYLNLNKADWSDFDANWTNAAITGNGTYTVSMTADAPVDLGQFNALEIVNGEKVNGGAYIVTVNSIKINGMEKRAGGSYTCSADEGGVTTRVNLYNEWNVPSEKVNNKGYVDCRCTDGDVLSKSAQIISYKDLSGVKSMEVTFTITGIGDPVPEDDRIFAAAGEEANEALVPGNGAGVPAAVRYVLYVLRSMLCL